MTKDSNFIKNCPEVDAKLKEAMAKGPQWGELSFSTGVLGDMLHGALAESWHLLAEQSREVMLIVLAELYLNSEAERLSDEKAADIVRRLSRR